MRNSGTFENSIQLKIKYKEIKMLVLDLIPSGFNLNLAINFIYLLLFSLVLCVICATVINPFLIAILNFNYRRKKRIVYANIAKQLADLGSWLGIVTFLAGLSFMASIWFIPGQILLEPQSHAHTLSMVVAIFLKLIGAFSICLAVFYKTSLRNLFMMGICFFGLLAIILDIVTIRSILVEEYAMSGDITLLTYLQLIFMPDINFGDVLAFFTNPTAPTTAKNDIFINLVYNLLALGISVNGALGLIWLVIMRNKDDYGRDHYILAGNFFGISALIGTLILSCTSAFEAWQIFSIIKPENPNDFWVFMGVAVFVPFLASICFATVGNSKNPMRLKSYMFIGFIVLWLFTALAMDVIGCACVNPRALVLS